MDSAWFLQRRASPPRCRHRGMPDTAGGTGPRFPGRRDANPPRSWHGGGPVSRAHRGRRRQCGLRPAHGGGRPPPGWAYRHRRPPPFPAAAIHADRRPRRYPPPERRHGRHPHGGVCMASWYCGYGAGRGDTPRPGCCWDFAEGRRLHCPAGMRRQPDDGRRRSGPTPARR